jgi:DNA-binding transcriptional ArsR family regulator
MSKRFAAMVAAMQALSDEGRMRIVLALRGRRLCVCQIVELMQLATSTVSEHLTILKAAGLVSSRKDGRWVYYRLTEKHADPAVAKVLACLLRELKEDSQTRTDAERLTEILQIDPADLCTRQKSGRGSCCERQSAQVR